MTDKNQQSDFPNSEPGHWFAIALSAGVFALFGVLIGAIWVFSAHDINTMALRARIITPFGAAGLAFVTFLTVIWRGIVAMKQAEEQKRQNDSADENNLALLYQKGAELICSKNEESEEVGVRVLATIMNSSNQKYLVPSMDLVFSFIQKNYVANSRAYIFRVANQALLEGEKNLGRKLEVSLSLDGKDVEEALIPEWTYIYGAKKQYYYNGEVNFVDVSLIPGQFRLFYEKELGLATLSSCQIRFGEFDRMIEAKITECSFENCTFRTLRVDQIMSNSFRNCNFTNCEIRRNQTDLTNLDVLVTRLREKLSGCLNKHEKNFAPKLVSHDGKIVDVPFDEKDIVVSM